MSRTVVCAACAGYAGLLAAVALAPAPWHLLAAVACVLLGVGTAHRHTAGRARHAPHMQLLDASAPRYRPSRTAPGLHHVYLELRIGRVVVSRVPGPGTDAEAQQPATPFPLDALSTVLDSGAEWSAPIRHWSLAQVTEQYLADHPAAPAYRALLGPLEIPGRRTLLLELAVDPLSLPPGGRVEDALRRLGAAVCTHLTHHRIWCRLVDDRHAADVARRFAAADATSRLLLDRHRLDPPARVDVPGLGAGPVLGADAEDRAVCLDLAGPHLGHVVWAGPADAVAPLLLRVAALGWRAVIVTDTPQRWRGLAGAAGWPLHLAADTDPGDGRSWSSSSEDPGGDGADDPVDAVLWDCAEPPEALLGRPAGRGPTLWQVLPQAARLREEALRAAAQWHPDLVVDARVSGWLTVETARRADGEEGPQVTVQAVTVPAEDALLAAAARRPDVGDVLPV